MPETQVCSPCCSDVQTENVPGSQGASAITLTTASFVIPAKNATVTIAVADTTWIPTGKVLFIGGCNFVVTGVGSTTSLTIKNLGLKDDTAVGVTVASGAVVAPGLGNFNVSLDLDAIAVLTDNTTGTAGNTLAAGVGDATLAFYVDLANIAAGDVLTNYVPGYRFKILSVDFRVNKAATTAAKAATLNLEIGTTDLTGGVVALTSANSTPAGAAVAGTAVSANNVGTSADNFSIEASAVTAFIEGSGWILVKIQNMDTADAAASIASKLNSILTALSATT